MNAICEISNLHGSFEQKVAEEVSSSWTDLAKRTALMALPFICLYGPAGRVIFLGAHCYTAIVSLTNLPYAENTEQVVQGVCRVSLATAAILCAVTQQIVALGAVTIGEMCLDLRDLSIAYQMGDQEAIWEISCRLLSSACYVGMLFTGLPEVILLALVVQSTLELRSSYLEFQKGKQIEGYGHLLLGLVRAFQAVPSGKIVYAKWLAPKEEKLKIVSFNILSDTTLGWFGDEVEKRPDDFDWDSRIERIHQALKEINADVICLQEVEPKSYEYLKQKFGDGFASSLALNDNKKFGSAIFVKKSAVEVKNIERIAYPGTTGRVVQIAQLKNKKDGKLIAVANTHLDQPTRDKQMTFLTELLQEKHGKQDRVICGDFNAKSTDDVGQVLDQAGYLHDDTAGYTNNHQNQEAKRIDGIYHTDGIDSSARAWKEIDIDTVLPNKEIASDHVPLLADLSWKSVAQMVAAKYRETSLFFDRYWNPKKNSLDEKKESCSSIFELG